MSVCGSVSVMVAGNSLFLYAEEFGREDDNG